MTRASGDHSVSWWPLKYTFAFLLLLRWTACSTPTGKLPRNFLLVQVEDGCSSLIGVCYMIVNLSHQWDVKRYLSGCPEEKICPVHT